MVDGVLSARSINPAFDVNWLCLYLVFFFVPVIELTGIYTGVTSSIPVAVSVAIEIFAILLTMSGCVYFVFVSNFRAQLYSCAYFLSSIFWIVYAARSNQLMGNFSSQFLVSVMSMIALAIIVDRLARTSAKYKNLHSFVAGAGALLLGALGVHGMLSLTIHELPYVCDPILYKFEHILCVSDVDLFVYLYSTKIFGYIAYQIYSYLNVFIILAAASEFIYSPKRDRAALFLRFFAVAGLG
ncbi:MAG: hypothetical protein POH28_14180, partial [Acidocella sp.]|nr:hypothetical protein [Acidocella sp.]